MTLMTSLEFCIYEYMSMQAYQEVSFTTEGKPHSLAKKNDFRAVEFSILLAKQYAELKT